MRNIVLVLVLLNIVFFLWWFRQDKPQDTPSLTLPGQVKTLEVYRPTRVEPSEHAIRPLPRVNSHECLEIGPIADKSRSLAAQLFLKDKGISSSWEERSYKGEAIPFAYRVYLPFDKREEAELAMQKLKEKDIKDTLITQKDEGFVLSLGVFTRYQGVEVRSQQVRELGYEPKTQERTREQATAFWLIIPQKKGPLPEHVIESVKEFGVHLNALKKAC